MKKLVLFFICLPFVAIGQISMTPDQWKKDLNYLHTKLEKRHANLYHTISRDEFTQEIENLKTLSNSVRSNELIVRISELIAKVGDAHTWLHPGYQDKWKFERLPLKFTYFKDGLFVTEADERFKDLIGSELVSINSTSVDDLMPMISKVGYNENDFTKLISIERFIVYPEVLKRFGIITDLTTVPLKLKTKGDIQSVKIKPTKRQSIHWKKHIDSMKELPLVYKQNDSIYWTELDPKNNMLYIQLNSIRENDRYSFKRLSEEIISKSQQNKVSKLVIDLRRNVGGNSRLIYPLIYALMDYEKKAPKGEIFIITGRWTLSASIILCAEIQKFCNPIFVGEPTGAKPNLYGENSYRITLPNSTLSISYSSEYFKPYGPFVNQDWISPDIYIPIKSQDYFNFEQPVLDAIKEYSFSNQNGINKVYELATNNNINEAIRVYKEFTNDPKNKYVDVSREIRRIATKVGRNNKLEYSKVLYELAHNDYPNNTHILVNLAQLYEDLKNKPKAIELYKKTLSLLSIDRQTNNYLKHYIEDYVIKRLSVL